MRYLIEYFIRFRQFVGRTIYYLLFLIMLVGFLEGVGVTLFLPILQGGFGDDKLSHILKFIFGFLHIEYSFVLILIFILVFFILRAVALILYTRYFGKVSSNLVVTLRRDIFSKVFNTDYLYVLKKEVGFINNAIMREIEFVVDAFRTFSYILNYALYGLVYLALAMLLNFKTALAITALGPFLVIITRRLNHLTNKISIDTSLSHGRFHSMLIQALSKIKYLKATMSNLRLYKIINNENRKLGDLRFRLTFLQSLSKNIVEPIVVLVVVGLFFHNVVILGKNVNEVVFLVFLFLQVSRQFLNAQTSYRKFLASMGSIKTFKDLQKELDENTEDLNLEGRLPDFDREILFKDVRMVFPNGKVGLENINITIKPKTTIALVGHSGSGKSTIANMVTAILKPTSGDIFFGDANYKEINLKALREKIGYVTQEDIIFNANIRDNISLWEEGVDNERLKRAIEIARIGEFVESIPQKENAMLGDNGLDISGGQRQRITIARELYKSAKLLILDEATSSLDSKAENRIYESLRSLRGIKTMLVIAHRLSTIKNADYIYVLDEGRVVEEGRYSDLIQKKAEFKKMIDEQKLVEYDEVGADA